MNSVSLIGTLTDDPTMRVNRAGFDECRIRLAVPRRHRTGRQEPGVVYVEVTTYGPDAVACRDRLRQGSRVGLSGRLEADPPTEGTWVAIDQLDFL